MVQHPLVDKVAFTGSTATASQIMKMAAPTLKKITLETGGKSPLLVFEDCDLEQAVRWSHISVISNQGQICTATSRILVQDSVYEEFVSKFREQVKQVSKIGDQWDPSTFQGPQVMREQYQRILSFVDVCRSEGATLIKGGSAHTGAQGKGFYIAPTVFTNVSSTMRIYRGEFFGPFVVLRTFSTEEEAINAANNTMYG